MTVPLHTSHPASSASATAAHGPPVSRPGRATLPAAKRRRDLLRLVHLAATLPLGALAYGPPDVALGLRTALQWVLFPALVLTGTWMWQGARLARLLHRGRARSDGRERAAAVPVIAAPTVASHDDTSTPDISRLATPAASPRSLRLLALAIGLGLLHHVDHVLRADRSGWPFIPEVTAFTASLLVYPVLAAAWRMRRRPRVSAAMVGVVLLAAQGSHTFIEHPHDQYAVWATGASAEPWAMGQPNLLHVQSPLLGGAAVTLAILLSLVLLGTIVSLLADARASRPDPGQLAVPRHDRALPRLRATVPDGP